MTACIPFLIALAVLWCVSKSYGVTGNLLKNACRRTSHLLKKAKHENCGSSVLSNIKLSAELLAGTTSVLTLLRMHLYENPDDIRAKVAVKKAELAVAEIRKLDSEKEKQQTSQTITDISQKLTDLLDVLETKS